MLGIAASENLEISTIDVKTAFLYLPIKETIYLKRPTGLSPNIMQNIVKLKKCIYGLCQAAHEWTNLLDRTIYFGFIQLKTDECVYKDTVVLVLFTGLGETVFPFFHYYQIIC